MRRNVSLRRGVSNDVLGWKGETVESCTRRSGHLGADLAHEFDGEVAGAGFDGALNAFELPGRGGIATFRVIV